MRIFSIGQITEGKLTNSEGRIVVPEAEPAELPEWLATEIAERFGRS
jgi:hypothetical protein